MIIKLPKTIKETHDGLLSGKFTAVDLVDSYLARIKKYDKDLNAFLTVSEDEAYVKVKKADKLVSDLGARAFEQYPLLGVVVAYKDLYLTKGIRTAAASKVLEGYIPSYNATVVERYDKAGAICIGKTNCDAWAHGASGENSDFGPTKNPWNRSYVPGGSSSGSAVSVAANMSLISTGTDTGGSIRQPASFCNVVGFKPTYGAVSRYGIIAMASSLDSVGHFARTVEDARTIYNVTKGPDGRDATVTEGNFKPKTSNFRVGIPKEFFAKGLDPEVEEKVREAITIYKKKGVDFKEVSLPMTKHAISVYYIVQPAEVSSNLGRYDGIRYGVDRSAFGSEAVRGIMLGTVCPFGRILRRLLP